ncbi:hypothetical protein Zmor_002220 [Zophobas morio]|uniref:Uncharacterized protein n=1 Tax=Zophobas morio TaxID=2755281 RepID=A0AA38MTA7_9CUCU|nr:hypothetical protein Zmor_002220 [Zophobas morio]
MRAKIQGHGPFLMTPFILLYEAGDITKARRPPTIHFPEQRLFVVVGPTQLDSHCIIEPDAALSTSQGQPAQWAINSS